MKILKYIFLLLLLTSIATTIFIATQKNAFTISKTILIKSKKSVVFDYVNDYKNWENWHVWEKSNSQTQLKYTNKTSGVGAAYYWNGTDGNGKTKTISIKENYIIVQKTTFNDAVSETSWTFKDTIGKTKITIDSKGEMPFMFKIYAFLNGGIEKVVGDKLEKSLVNLDRSLDYELNTYSVKPNGIVIKKGTFYLNQTINCKISKLSYNLKIIIPNLTKFSNDNNLKINGRPFVIYNLYDTKKGITNVSVCVPIKNRIFTSTGSDINCSELKDFIAYKTTLIGAYSHRDIAWKKGSEFLLKEKKTQDKLIPIIEILTVGLVDEKRPSKWETGIYIPIHTNLAIRKPINRSINSSIDTSEIEPQK